MVINMMIEDIKFIPFYRMTKEMKELCKTRVLPVESGLSVETVRRESCLWTGLKNIAMTEQKEMM